MMELEEMRGKMERDEGGIHSIMEKTDYKEYHSKNSSKLSYSATGHGHTNSDFLHFNYLFKYMQRLANV